MKIKIALLSLLIGGQIYAQSEADVLRYSSLDTYGTARFNAMGGAFGSLGADLSVAGTNPAGLAQNSGSIFSFSPGFLYSNTKTNYEGKTTLHDKLNFNFNNIGLVLTKEVDNYSSPLKRFNFGITYNRMASFHRNYTINGNSQTSLLESFALDSDNILPENLTEDLHYTSNLAYETYALSDAQDTSNNFLGYYFVEIPQNATLDQKRTVKQRGKLGETAISFSGALGKYVLLGASVGIIGTNFKQIVDHNETVVADEGKDLDNFTFTENLESSGAGINGKFGVILIPTKWIRVGIAYHTPSIIRFEESYFTTMNTNFTNGDKYNGSSEKGIFEYRIKTPNRIIASGSLILGKIALLSAEVERIDYSKAALLNTFDNNQDYSSSNNQIKATYTQAYNFRAGAEVKAGPLAFRGGIRLNGNPFNEASNVDRSKTIYSFGTGISSKSVNFDVSYSLGRYKDTQYMYNVTELNPAIVNTTEHNIVMTLGFKF